MSLKLKEPCPKLLQGSIFIVCQREGKCIAVVWLPGWMRIVSKERTKTYLLSAWYILVVTTAPCWGSNNCNSQPWKYEETPVPCRWLLPPIWWNSVLEKVVMLLIPRFWGWSLKGEEKIWLNYHLNRTKRVPTRD